MKRQEWIRTYADILAECRRNLFSLTRKSIIAANRVSDQKIALELWKKHTDFLRVMTADEARAKFNQPSVTKFKVTQ